MYPQNPNPSYNQPSMYNRPGRMQRFGQGVYKHRSGIYKTSSIVLALGVLAIIITNTVMNWGDTKDDDKKDRKPWYYLYYFLLTMSIGGSFILLFMANIRKRPIDRMYIMFLLFLFIAMFVMRILTNMDIGISDHVGDGVEASILFVAIYLISYLYKRTIY